MKQIKIIALDLDDTLLKDDLTISDYTVSVLQRAMNKGIFVVLASGRSLCSMAAYMERIGCDQQAGYVICNNGSQIMTSDTRQELIRHCLDESLALAIYDNIEPLGLSCHLYVDDTLYAAKHTRFSDRDSHLTSMQLVVPEDFRTVLRTHPVYKLLMPAEPDRMPELEAAFKREFAGKVTIFTSKPYFLEFIPLGTGKGEALLELASRLGIKKQELMAFGDSMNDETMIQLAGYGIAMQNGLPHIKAHAYAVTDYTNNEDGIAHFLEQYVL
ncbi:MAG: Cof-type HAD-IIB family hydrolase [Treponema sp.]